MLRITWLGWLSTAVLLSACGGQSENVGTGGAAGVGGASASGGGGTGAVAGTGGSGAVDGGSGGTVSGGSGGIGASGGAPGGGGAPCNSLAEAYVDTLKKAKVCNPFIDMEECTQKVADALMCPCGTTFVNPGNVEAMKTLGDLQYFWDAQKCGDGIGCPAIACEEPALGSCTADSATATGACQDMYTNSN